MGENHSIWQKTYRGYRTYLKLERALAENSVESYLRDVRQFASYITDSVDLPPNSVTREMVERYIMELTEAGLMASSVQRVICSLRSLFEWLITQSVIESSPMLLIESPRISRHLPDILSVDEIDRMISLIDSRSVKGLRDRAILEMLYSCGLRVSELISLQLTDLFFDEGYIRVLGKGSKQRLVPVSDAAQRCVEEYIPMRSARDYAEGRLFLNNRGGGLSRVMVFYIIKAAARSAEISSDVSPHTMRHSFATHLLEGGASIRDVQELLGHESITTTEIYTHVSRQHLLETINILRNTIKR